MNRNVRPSHTLAQGTDRGLPQTGKAGRQNRSLAMGRGSSLDRGIEMSTPLSCPKFSRCNAPICPLDEKWAQRSMLGDETVCFYLLEHSKAGARARFHKRGLGEIYEVIGRVLADQSSKWGRIRRSYERAKASGSRLEKRPIWIKGKEYVET